jgi:hypothetical protein
MAAAGYDRLLGLLAGTEQPIALAEADEMAVEFLQEMIRCHAYRLVPGRKNHTVPPIAGGETFGTYGMRTGKAVEKFKQKYDKAHPAGKLPASTPRTAVDRETLQALIDWTTNQTTPGAGRLYLEKVLGLTYDVWHKMAALISTYEESINGGGFTALSPKSQSWIDANNDGICDTGRCDEAGMSYGIIQFTHQSGRLAALLRDMRAANQALFDQTFRVPGTTITGLLDHLDNFATQTTHGIANLSTYDLYSARWKNCLLTAGRIAEFQKRQIDAAITALKASYRRIKVTAGGYAPHLTNERGIGFWLDVSNQYGDAGAQTRYTSIVQELQNEGTPVTQAAILDKAAGPGTYSDRRQYFRDYVPLDDPGDPFARA